VKRLLHRLKFEGLLVAARPLAELALDVLRSHPFATAGTVVVPVPAHWQSRLRRGYNQSEWIAWYLAKGLRLPFRTALAKSRTTVPQVNLPRTQRLENPSGTCRARRVRRIRGQNVLLVDDVMTTAATASECARALKEGGAAEVYAFAVARQA
jgi:ComF family protein